MTTTSTIHKNLAGNGAEPGRASGSCPSGGPPSPRFSATEAAGRPSDPQPSWMQTFVASGDQQLTILIHSHSEEEVMTTTTTAAGPTESQLRHGGTVPSPTLSKEKGERPRMVRLTVNLPSHLVEQMRDAVYWTPGLTLAWLIARAVRASLADLETIHQGPFPRRLKPLRAGRPRLVGQSMNVRPLGSGEGTDGTGKNALRPVTPVIGRN